MPFPGGSDSAGLSPVDDAEAALESTCAALVTLELIRLRIRGNETLEPHAVAAIEALQQAIAEVRVLRDQQAAVLLPHGFVIGDEDQSPSATRADTPVQSSP